MSIFYKMTTRAYLHMYTQSWARDNFSFHDNTMKQCFITRVASKIVKMQWPGYRNVAAITNDISLLQCVNCVGLNTWSRCLGSFVSHAQLCFCDLAIEAKCD